MDVNIETVSDLAYEWIRKEYLKFESLWKETQVKELLQANKKSNKQKFEFDE